MIRPGMLQTVEYTLMDPQPTESPDPYWGAVTDVPCPRCTTGIVRWAEAGYVPGYRVCDVCGQAWFAAGTRQRPALAPPVEFQPGCWGPARAGVRVPVHLHRSGLYARRRKSREVRRG